MQIRPGVIALIILLTIGCTSKQEEIDKAYDNIKNYREFILEVSQGIISSKSESGG